jgi:2-iminobutanoate/2-iminopropanoate deaminase
MLKDGCNSHCGGCNDNKSHGCNDQDVEWHEVFFDNECVKANDSKKGYSICNDCNKYDNCDLINEFFEKYFHQKHNLKKVRGNNEMLKKVDLNEKDLTFSSYVVAGDYIYTSHIGGIKDDQGNRLGSVREQTEQALKNLQGMLEREDIDLSDVINTTVYLRDLEEFDEMREVFRRYFKDNYPTRMTATTDFIDDGCLVMIVAVAYKPE